MTDNTKIYFEIPDAGETESLWAEPAEAKLLEKRFRLLNSPFFVYGVSFLDVVIATPRSYGNGYDFVRVDERSGNSTYRVIADPAVFENSELWEKLHALGCAYESAPHDGQALFSINVPAQANIYYVYGLLDMGEQTGLWIFEEANVGHAVDNEWSK